MEFGHEQGNATHPCAGNLLPATIGGSIAHAQDMFKLLGEKEIRDRVVGKDITDALIG